MTGWETDEERSDAHVADLHDTAVEQLRRLERIGPTLAGVARVAAHLAGAATAAVHVVDGVHLRTIGTTGGPLGSEPAVFDACRGVLEAGAPLFTADASRDPRLSGSPLVTGQSAVRFFAAFPLRSSRGRMLGVLCLLDPEARPVSAAVVQRLLDLAGEAQTQLELMSLAIDLGRQAMLDPLTGLVNRAVFDDRLEHSLARARRRRATVFVAIIDVDDFKLVNDSVGHSGGDEVLRLVARRLREVAREEDTIGRLGGDEFGLVAEVSLPGAQRLQQRLEVAFSGPLDPQAHASVTVGAALAQTGDDPREALARAHRAMFAAKQQPGRRLRLERGSRQA